MNLLKGSIRVNGKPSFVTEAGVELPLKSAPGGTDGRPCVYGIRPEHLTLGGRRFEAEISVVEPTGSETQVFAKLGGQHDRRRVSRADFGATGRQICPFSPNLGAVHLFDAGKRQAAGVAGPRRYLIEPASGPESLRCATK